MAWMIVGDTERYKGCLIRMCYGTREMAESELDRINNNPTREDAFLSKGYTNLRIEKTGREQEVISR